MKAALILLTALLVNAVPRTILAHGGGLDANGGHMDRRTGSYHYHGGGGGGGWGSNPQGFSFGYGGMGTTYVPPAPRQRARATARATARTGTRTTSPGAEPFKMSLAPDGEDGENKIANPGNSAGVTPVSPGPTAAGSDPEALERRAQELLRLAKVLLKQGKSAGAMKYLKELTDLYPETKGGKEGAQLMRSISQGSR